MGGLTIGQVAREASVNVETLRYYERRGLLPHPPRSASNYRLYSPETVVRVGFVKRAQELGFSLKEIRQLLALRATRGARCSQVRRQASAKIKDIDDKIRSLEAMRKALSKLVAQCSGAGPVTECPILEALETEKG